MWTFPADAPDFDAFDARDVIAPDTLTLASLNGETDRLDWSVNVDCRPESMTLTGEVMAYIDCENTITLRARDSGEVIVDGLVLPGADDDIGISPLGDDLLLIHQTGRSILDAEQRALVVDHAGTIVDSFEVFTAPVSTPDGSVAYLDPKADNNNDDGDYPREVLVRDVTQGASIRTGIMASKSGALSSVRDTFLVANPDGTVAFDSDSPQTSRPFVNVCPDDYYDQPQSADRFRAIRGAILVDCPNKSVYALQPSE